MKNIKMLRLPLAIMLTLVLGISTFNVNLVAEEVNSETNDVLDINNDNKITYMSIGDSMTNGYGMDSYYPAQDGKPEGTVLALEELKNWSSYEDHTTSGNVFGYNRHVYETYAGIFTQYLEDNTSLDVEWLPSAISGMRSEDLLWLLDSTNEYEGDMYTDFIWKNGNYNEGRVSRFISAKYGRWSSFVDELGDEMTEVDHTVDIYDVSEGTYYTKNYYVESERAKAELDLFREEYKQRIKTSDIISVHLGTHGFSSVVSGRLLEILGMSDNPYNDERNTLDFILNKYPNLKVLYGQYEDQIKGYVSDALGFSQGPIFDALIDIFGYATLSAMYSYDRLLEEIKLINPDVQIIILGINNFLDGLCFTNPDGSKLDLGGLFGKLISVVNLHRSSLAKGAFKSIYVDTLKDVDTLLDSFVAKDMNETYLATTLATVKDLVPSIGSIIEFADNDPRNLNSGLSVQIPTPSGAMTVKLLTGNSIHRFLLNYLNAKTDEEKAAAISSINWIDPSYASYSDNVLFGTASNPGLIPQVEYLFDTLRGYASKDEFDFDVLVKVLSGVSDDETTMFMANLSLRCFTADGIGCHTSESGHIQVAEAMIDAHMNNYTGKDHFLETIEPLYPLLEKYGPSALQFIFNKFGVQDFIDEIELKVNETVEELIAFKDNAQNNILTILEELKVYYEARLELLQENPVEAVRLTVEDIKTTISLIEKSIESIKSTISQYDDEIQCIVSTFNNIVNVIKNTTVTDVQYKVYELLAELENLSNGFLVVEDMANAIENEYRNIEAYVDGLYQEALDIHSLIVEELIQVKLEAEDYLNLLVEEISNEVNLAVEEIYFVLSQAKDEAVAYFNQLGIDLENKVNYILYQLSISKEQAIEEALLIIDEIKNAINGSADELMIRLESYVADINVFIENVKAELVVEIENVIEKAQEIYSEATSDEYVTNEESYYVALGDSSAEGDSYVDMFASKLYLDESKYNNLAVKGMRLEDVYYLLNADAKADQYFEINFASEREYYLAEVLKADIITLGFNGLDYTLAQLGSLVPYDNDWSVYFGDEIAELIDKGIIELEKELQDDLGMLTKQAITILESYIYNYVGSLITYNKVLTTINELNPNALVITVGTYNPFTDLVIDNDGKEINISNYLTYLFGSFDVLHLASSISNDLGITVLINGVETVFDTFESDEMDVPNYVKVVQLLLANPDVFLPSEAGHNTIATSLIAALTHSCQHVACDDDNDCTTDILCKFCGVVLEEGADSHTEEEIPAVAATCSSVGYTKGSKCSVCGTILVEPEEVAKLNHEYDNDCDNSCNICGAKNESLKPHKYDNKCDETCNICGGLRRTLGHVFGDWTVVQEATKREEGKQARTCEECGYVEYRSIPVIKGMGTGAVVAIVGGSTLVGATGAFSIVWFGVKKRRFSDLKNIFRK